MTISCTNVWKLKYWLSKSLRGHNYWAKNPCIQSGCLHGVFISSFPEWKQAVASAIDEKRGLVSNKLTTENRKNTLKLKDKITTEELKMLLNKFGVTPIDKIVSSAGFVCQKHWAKILIYEFDLIYTTQRQHTWRQSNQ